LKITGTCVPCLLTRGLFECKNYTQGESEEYQKEMEARCMRAGVDALYAGYSPDICSAILATEIHRGIYLALATDDQYDLDAQGQGVSEVRSG